LEIGKPLISPTPNQNFNADEGTIETQVKEWIQEFVIGFNLCPFARKEFDQGNIRFKVSEPHSDEDLLIALASELELLEKNTQIETSIVIIHGHLKGFSDYCDFIERANSLLFELGLEGIFQIAGFHPEYQFAGTQAAAAENYTNRSPLPLLHILREDSVESAVENHPNADNIPAKNIERMNKIGAKKLRELFSKFRPL
tara:strand:+ start:1913 stop:2509 length:597 start_codon:yes stop_codon:yes gene_type:complete